MPARNIYHDRVRNALAKDGWTVTDDPYQLEWGGKRLFVDLAAERVMTAEKGGVRIAVEIQSFVGPSDVHDLQAALGQYMVYQVVMEQADPGRKLYLAVSRHVYDDVFAEPLGHLTRERLRVPVIVFDPTTEEIHQWID